MPLLLIACLRFYGHRSCPGVSLSTDITTGWGPEVMLLSSPPPGTYTFKVHQYSAAGSLRYLDCSFGSHSISPDISFRESGAIVSFYGATPEPLIFRPTSDGTLQGPQPAARAVVFCHIFSCFAGQFWNIFSFTVAADGGITLGGQAQLANCQPPRLADANIRLADCRSNGCRVEVLSNVCVPQCVIVTLRTGSQ